MMRPQLILIGLSACALSCRQQENAVVEFNTPPAATILAPEDDLAVQEGAAISFRGTVSDQEDGSDGLLVTWSSDLDGPLNSDPADPGGATEFSTANIAPRRRRSRGSSSATPSSPSAITR